MKRKIKMNKSKIAQLMSALTTLSYAGESKFGRNLFKGSIENRISTDLKKICKQCGKEFDNNGKICYNCFKNNGNKLK
jgi:hypothetical protein